MKLLGREGGLPVFAAFPVLPVAGGRCCWWESLVVDLLSSSFLHSLFSLGQLAGESSLRPVGLVQSKRYFFAAFLALSQLLSF